MPRFGGPFSFASPSVQDLCPKFQVNLLAPGPRILEDSKPSLRFLSSDPCRLETHHSRPTLISSVFFPVVFPRVHLNPEPSRQRGFGQFVFQIAAASFGQLCGSQNFSLTYLTLLPALNLFSCLFQLPRLQFYICRLWEIDCPRPSLPQTKDEHKIILFPTRAFWPSKVKL